MLYLIARFWTQQGTPSSKSFLIKNNYRCQYSGDGNSRDQPQRADQRPHIFFG